MWSQWLWIQLFMREIIDELRPKNDERRSKLITCEVTGYRTHCLWGLKSMYWGLKMMLGDLNLSNVKSLVMNSTVCEVDKIIVLRSNNDFKDLNVSNVYSRVIVHSIFEEHNWCIEV
jgi:hypothetical protein